MPTMPKSPALVCLLGVLLSACRGDASRRALPTSIATVAPEPRPTVGPPRIMSRAETRNLLLDALRERPGDAALLRRQVARMDSTDARFVPPARLTSTTETTADDPATWPKAQIVEPTVMASLTPPHPFVYASMYHNGHLGRIDLKYTLSDSKGTLQTYDHTTSDFNVWGRLRFSLATQSVQVFTSATCGAVLRAEALFTSYYVINPLDIPLGEFGTIPATVGGQTNVKGDGQAEQGPCADSGSGGGPSSGDSSYSYIHMECWYTDWYNGDGTYLFTTFDGCTMTVMEA